MTSISRGHIQVTLNGIADTDDFYIPFSLLTGGVRTNLSLNRSSKSLLSNRGAGRSRRINVRTADVTMVCLLELIERGIIIGVILTTGLMIVTGHMNGETKNVIGDFTPKNV